MSRGHDIPLLENDMQEQFTRSGKLTVRGFWPKVNKHGPISTHRPDLGPCWLWLGKPIKDGYGRFYTGHHGVLAHRYSYTDLVGEIPLDKEIDHLCRVRLCVNTLHLEAVDHLTNVRRGDLSGSGLRRGKQQSAKAICPRGHSYAGDNLYINPSNNGRVCRTCAKEYGRRKRPSRLPDNSRINIDMTNSNLCANGKLEPSGSSLFT